MIEAKDDPTEAKAPEIWADLDGCLLSPADPFYGKGTWFAFGNGDPMSLEELTGRDRPVHRLFDENGFYVGPKCIYAPEQVSL